MQKYCSIQIDLDDNQCIQPRQRNLPYDPAMSDAFLQGIKNMERFLMPYPIALFVVGLDMTVEAKVHRIRELLKRKPDIEIANHSYSHFNNFNSLTHYEKEKEILDADAIIKTALDIERIYGFRSPGYIFNNEIIEILKANAYTYDASLLPSYFGPVLRSLNYFINKVPGKDNFGHIKNGFMPNEPTPLDKERKFFEINVSVCPVLRIPINYSIIRSKSLYSAIAPFIKKIQCLNFIFHLDDFVNIDTEKLRHVLKLITIERNIILPRDICNLLRKSERPLCRTF